MGTWAEIDHTADVALRVSASDFADLFATAARGMFSLLVALDAVTSSLVCTVDLQALDAETLLVDWLNELLYLAESGPALRAFVAFEFAVLEPTHLRAVVRGGEVPGFFNYLKAATFHNLEITATQEGYVTTLVFDT
ncbi:MAG: archease [Anaerolineae bacterium]|nr:archease [Anaerolineae bacterium]